MEHDPSELPEAAEDVSVFERIKQGADMLATRRDFLGRGLAVTGMLMLSGAAAAIEKSIGTTEARTLERAELSVPNLTTDSCVEATCEVSTAIPDEAQVIRAELPPTPTTSTTTTPPATTTTAPPTPELKAVAPPAIEQEILEHATAEKMKLPNRKMPFSEFEANKEQMISALPSLERLNASWGKSPFYKEVARQKEYIEYLKSEVNLSPGGYEDFLAGLDLSRNNSFRNMGEIVPRMVVWHWTGDHYDDVDHFVRALGPSGRNLGVQAYIHADGSAHQLMPTLRHKAMHALYMEDFSVGVEIYSGEYNGQDSPLFSYTPATVTSGLYMAMKMYKEIQSHHPLPIDRTTFVSHHSGDLIFVNPYYNPHTGEFSSPEGYEPPNIRKHDVVQPMMNMLLEKLVGLEREFALAA